MRRASNVNGVIATVVLLAAAGCATARPDEAATPPPIPVPAPTVTVQTEQQPPPMPPVSIGPRAPEPPRPEPYEGRERWSVELYLQDGRRLEVRCGALREGVSRETAQAVFDAVRRGAGEASEAEPALQGVRA